MTKTITFTVPDHVAEDMSVRAVYLDVFGWVRWVNTGDVVSGSPRWAVRDTDELTGRPVSLHQEPETERGAEEAARLPTTAELREALSSKKSCF